MTKGEVAALRAWLKRSLDIETHGNIDVLCDAAESEARLRVAATAVVGNFNKHNQCLPGDCTMCDLRAALAEQPNVRKGAGE